MPIKRFEELEFHDPTSPECMVAKQQLEESATWQKAAEVKLITSLVAIVCAMVSTIAIVFAAVAICQWSAEHRVEYVNVYRYCPGEYGTIKMEENQ